ncbi:MAG: response regulator [Desulfobacteraceae bacterium]|nr:response regulator [Desulfobacteraceae bacterium]
MNINSHLLGDILIKRGHVSKAEIAEALQVQQSFIEDLLVESDFDRSELISINRAKKNDEIPMLGQILIQKGFIEEEDLVQALETQSKLAMDLHLLDSEKLANVLKVGFVINSTIDILEVLSLIMKYANIVTDATASTLMLLDEKTGELVFSVPTGPNTDELKDIRIPPGVGVAGWVVENQKPLLVSDSKKDARFYSQIDDISGVKTESLLCVPMRSNRRIIGVLEVINKRKGEYFNEEDSLLLSIFSHHAAIAIENAMLFQAMHNRIEKEKMIEKKISESERVRSIGTLAAGIAHDFNNILGGIVGYAELARMDALNGSDQYNYLEKLLGATGRAKALILQILTYSRQSENEFKPVRVNVITKEALKLLRAAIPKSIDLVEDLCCRSVIMGDSTQIHQIIMNLCTNAKHAIKNNEGSIKVSLNEVIVECFSDKNNLELVPGPYLKLSVEDNGIGMPSHIVKRIYEPFFTTKSNGQGTGMGLSMVHGIVKGHNGEIKVKSKLGKGTVFDIYLPIINKKLDSNSSEASGHALCGEEHILFVDDEIMLLDAPKKILNSLGYKVTIENSSKEALKRFKSNPEEYDIVITDMTMPEMMGDIMAQEMMNIRPNIPIIICTGYNSRLTKDSAKQIGFEAFLMKPFQMKTLSQKIREVLDKNIHD